MGSGNRYRVVSFLGATLLVSALTLIANHLIVQTALTVFPVVDHLSPETLTGEKLWLTDATATLVTLLVLTPLFEPRPRRILGTAIETGRRVMIAMGILAAIGYFDYTYRIPRTTLLILSVLMMVFMPVWLTMMQRRLTAKVSRAVVIGDDSDQLGRIARTTDLTVVGYVSPLGRHWNVNDAVPEEMSITDGGVADRHTMTDNTRAIGTPTAEFNYLGRLSQLGSILIEYDIDTAILALSRPDRAAFFGALDTCRKHGVAAKIHRDYANSVLTVGADNTDAADIVAIELEPLDWYEYVLKRTFDIVFASIGLVMLAPVIMVIAAAIKWDSQGPILYSQERTATFGETFQIYKFRSMVPKSENTIPTDDHENDRITRVGRFLRQTHLDEIPQLWLILRGDMSVVGPRAAWTEEEVHIEQQNKEWRKRWFIKPGLTGLAQINDISSTNPEAKLRYDVYYIREQSFWLDVKIFIRQIWKEF